MPWVALFQVLGHKLLLMQPSLCETEPRVWGWLGLVPPVCAAEGSRTLLGIPEVTLQGQGGTKPQYCCPCNLLVIRNEK